MSASTHPVLNNEYDFSVLRSDIINIASNLPRKVIIAYESCNGTSKIIPTITLPSKRGWMKTAEKDDLYMLSPCVSSDHTVCEVEVLSELGCLDISYHCEVSDYRNKPFWGSSKILRRLGMVKEIISTSKVRYSCTDTQSGLFNCFVFTVEWVAI